LNAEIVNIAIPRAFFGATKNHRQIRISTILISVEKNRRRLFENKRAAFEKADVTKRKFTAKREQQKN